MKGAFGFYSKIQLVECYNKNIPDRQTNHQIRHERLYRQALSHHFSGGLPISLHQASDVQGKEDEE